MAALVARKVIGHQALMLSRLLPDRFVLLLLGAMAFGWMLPVSGRGLVIAQSVSSVSIFALFFLHGLRLPRAEVVKAAKGWKLQRAMLAFTFVAMPLAALVMAKSVGVVFPAALLTGLLYCAMLPSTVQSAISYSSIAGGNVAASVVGAAVSNLAGILVTPLLVALVIGAASGVSLGSDTLLRIATMLLLPFAIGQLAQGMLGTWAHRQKSLLSFFDRLVIVIAVYVAFAGAVTSGSLAFLTPTNLALLLCAVGFLLLFAFGAAAGLGDAFRFNRADRISLIFAGAHKSIATGAPMAAILFGNEAGLILLPAIIYHIAQLLVSAPLAQRLRQGLSH
jgi:solute carrier family 10 (sodium/bile acid cotransporter), member 7